MSCQCRLSESTLKFLQHLLTHCLGPFCKVEAPKAICGADAAVIIQLISAQWIKGQAAVRALAQPSEQAGPAAELMWALCPSAWDCIAFCRNTPASPQGPLVHKISLKRNGFHSLKRDKYVRHRYSINSYSNNLAPYFMPFSWPWPSEACSMEGHWVSLVHNCPHNIYSVQSWDWKFTFVPLDEIYPKWRMKLVVLSGFYCLICFTLNIISWCPFQWLIQLGMCAVEHYFWWAYSCMSWGTSTEKLPLWEETENQWTHTHTKPGILKVIESVMLPLNTYSWKHLQVLSKSHGNLECIFWLIIRRRGLKMLRSVRRW